MLIDSRDINVIKIYEAVSKYLLTLSTHINIVTYPICDDTRPEEIIIATAQTFNVVVV